MANKTEKLEAQLNSTTDPQQEIDILNELAWELKDIDEQRAFTLCQQAHDLAQQGQFESNRYQKGLAYSLSYLGYFNYYKANYQLALSQSLEAIALFEKLDHPSGLPTPLCIIGLSYLRLGNYSETLPFLLKALNIAEELNDQAAQARAFNDIAIVNVWSGDHEQAQTYFANSLKIYQQIDHKLGEANALLNLCMTYRDLGQYDKSLEHGFQSVEICREINNHHREAVALNNIGNTYLALDQNTEALTYLHQALELVQKLDDKFVRVFTLLHLGRAYHKQKQLEAAQSYLHQALTLAQESEQKGFQFECHQALAETYKDQGDFEQALNHFEQFHTVKETVFNKEAYEKLKNLEVLHRTETAKKEAEIYQLKNVALEQEIADRKQAEAALRRRNQELTLLNQVGQELSATLNTGQVSGQLLQAVTETIDTESASIWLWDEEQEGWLRCQAVFRPDRNRSLVDLRLAPGQGVAGWVAQTGESAIVPNVADDSRFYPDIDKLTGFRTRSLLTVPLWVRDKVIGVLEAANKIDCNFDADDRILVETLAASAAIAIQNAQLVEALQKYTAELQAQNEELNAFAHTVAHDLKHPLGHIVGFAEFLEEEYAALPDEELYQYLYTIAQGGRKMERIIDELLLLAGVRQKKTVKVEPLDMTSIVAEARKRLTDLTKEHKAEVIVTDTWPTALGYAPWIEEVWVNYISNAIKYGGKPPRIELNATVRSDGQTCFWVHDNGSGLTQKEQERLFTPFTRLDQTRTKGHGLGLSIVRRIVERLGGQAGVKSHGIEGEGSTFWFTLPIEEIVS